MNTPLVIDNEEAVRLAAALADLTGESLAASVVTALRERLARESESRRQAAGRTLARAIAANLRQEGQHLAGVPAFGWCGSIGGDRR